ncbi:hypothetical protein WA158_001293 [Blastocystis sp. Blastoise]
MFVSFILYTYDVVTTLNRYSNCTIPISYFIEAIDTNENYIFFSLDTVPKENICCSCSKIDRHSICSTHCITLFMTYVIPMNYKTKHYQYTTQEVEDEIDGNEEVNEILNSWTL